MTKKVNIDIVARDKTKRAIDSSKKSLGGLKKFALAASAALATIGAGRAITGLVRVGKEMESLQIRFKLLFGSAEEGAKAFDTLSSFAAKVPFSLGDIAAASGNLAVVAKDAKELNDILEITGNVAGATGLDFQTTASQIQRAFAGGIASADIFREKGVRDMLGFSAGAKISVEETREAFARVFAGNGEFAKTTEELAKTLEGTLSMINDKFLNFQLAINKAFFAELKNQFGDLNKFLEQNEEKIEAFGEDIGETLAGSLIALANAVKTVKDNLEEFELALGAILLAAGGLIKILAGLGLVYSSLTGKQQELIDKTLKYRESLLTLGMEDVIADIERMTQAQIIQVETNDVVAESLSTVAMGYTDIGNACQIAGEKVLTFDQILENATKKQQEAEEKKTADFQRNLENFKDIKFKELDFEELTQEQREKMTKEGFRTALSEGAKHNKAMFRLNQALNIGEAIMNTATGITSALKLGPVGIPLAVAIGAMGAVQIAAIASQQPPAQFGGSRLPNSPFLVGERGPELFTPSTAGTVPPNHQLGGGGATVNFNITTVDASSFGALLDTRRGQIVNMINSALNNKGQAALV